MFHAFPRFPQGLIGLGLLVARFAGAAQALAWCLLLSPSPICCGAALLAALALAVGLLARSAALMLAVMIGAIGIRAGEALGALLIFSGAHLLGVALSGPGAYAVDARLFGRRVIRVGSRHTSV